MPRPLCSGTINRASGALSVLALLACCGGVQAGGSPENVLLLVNPSSQESMYLANYYRYKRNIPESNVLYVDPGAQNYAAFTATNANLDALFGTLRNRRLDDHIDYIVVAGTDRFQISASGLVSDGCFPVSRFSQSSVYTMSFLKDQILAGGMPSVMTNHYSSPLVNNTFAFDSNTAYYFGSPSTHPAARRYFIGAQLGYTGERGNTLPEILLMIDRSVAADGTRPVGKFYFMNNLGDPIRNVRACNNTSCSGDVSAFNSAIAALASTGGVGEIINAVLPANRHDILGVVTGAATPNIDGETMTILPGAFADHLTSYAGAFDGADQVKMSAWIRRGASGTGGTVEEPCNYPGKFPHANLHVLYQRGLSLGEAYFRSLSYVPFQQLLLGDPLTRPFATFPTIIPNVPTGTVSGAVTFTPQAATTLPGAAIAQLEVHVNGVLRATSAPGQPVTLQTHAFPDGVNEVRILAFDNTLVKNVGRWVGTLTTSNHGSGATIALNAASGDLNTAFFATIGSSGPGVVQEVRLLQNGRVVAARTNLGALTVYGRNLGAGRSSLRAEILYAGDRVSQSAPAEVNIAYSGAPASATPVAFSYTKRIFRGGPAVIELPAAFPSDPAGASYAVITPPAQATIGGGSMNYRVITVPASAAGSDTLVFRVTTPSGISNNATVTLLYTDLCYANCDGSTAVPVLNVADFTCFLQKFAAGDPYANCDNSTTPPVLNVADFTCFLQKFASGCD